MGRLHCAIVALALTTIGCTMHFMQSPIDNGCAITWHSLNGALEHVDDDKPFFIFISSNDCAKCDAFMRVIESYDVANFLNQSFVSIISNVDYDGVVIANAPFVAIMSYDKVRKQFVVSSAFDGALDNETIMAYLEYGIALHKLRTVSKQ